MERRSITSRSAVFCAVMIAAICALIGAGAGCGDPKGSVGPNVPTAGASSESSAPRLTAPSASETFTPQTTMASTTTTIFPITTPPGPAETILQTMTLPEKAAQVFLLSFSGTTLFPGTDNLLRVTPPGGLLLLSHNVTGPRQLMSLTAALQNAAAAGGRRIGLLIAVDQEGGPVRRIHSGVPDVPAARVLGEEASLHETMRLADETATDLLRLGVNMNLAPVADVVSDPESFLYRRTYGGDPTRVTEYVRTVTAAYMRPGLIAVVKHFPGHGSARGNTHGQIVISDASQAEFATTHFLPFKGAFATGVECVMVSHIVANAYDRHHPASLSEAVVQELLRDGLGFAGVIVTDDLEMIAAPGMLTEDGQIGGERPQTKGANIGDIAIRALEAGCDLLIATGTAERQLEMRDAVVEAVEQGLLDSTRLDEAVLRILELKARHGLLLP